MYQPRRPPGEILKEAGDSLASVLREIIGDSCECQHCIRVRELLNDRQQRELLGDAYYEDDAEEYEYEDDR